MPATSFPPIMNAGFITAAAPFFAVLEGLAELPGAIPPVEVAARSRVWPTLGREAVGFTSQPFGVVAGQAIGLRLDADDE